MPTASPSAPVRTFKVVKNFGPWKAGDVFDEKQFIRLHPPPKEDVANYHDALLQRGVDLGAIVSAPTESPGPFPGFPE